jgi:uncharacterized protein
MGGAQLSCPGDTPSGMSSEPETVRALFEAFNRGDMGAFLELCDPDIEWDLSRRLIDPEIYSGREGVGEFFEQQREVWEEAPRMEIDELIDAGEDVVAFVRVRGRGKGSGVEVEAEIAQIWTIRDGKAIRLQYYGDRREALRAVGRLSRGPEP